MASITIRRLEEKTKQRLRIRAARNGRSMEEEARQILKVALNEKRAPGLNLVESIRRIVDPLGGINLPDIPRGPMRPPPTFD
ncbi:MAG: plasmid stabilization protein [Bryobacteraceae bacterium]|jgi:plasmid stability protein